MRTIIDDKVYDVFCTHCDSDDVMLSEYDGYHIICPKCDNSRSLHPSDKGRIGAGPINAIRVDEEAEKEISRIDELEERIKALEDRILYEEIEMD